MSRGKSYEGEDFTLSWTVTLQVPDNKSQPYADGCGKKGARPMKTILDGIVGQAEKGQLVAVMGSSGCGKTSFLDCVSMRNQRFKGNIFINGKELDGRYFSLAGQ
jgi:ABC-type multidrug transport system ATPase subunit